MIQAMHERIALLPFALLRRQAQRAVQGMVDAKNAIIRIKNHNHIRHGLERLLPFLLGAQDFILHLLLRRQVNRGNDHFFPGRFIARHDHPGDVEIHQLSREIQFRRVA